MKELSIIIPVYNEQNNIFGVIKNLLACDLGMDREIIIVNDGSTDNSLEEIEKFKDVENVKIISNYHNRGYGASLKIGIRNAEAKYICTYDGDGQFFPEDIKHFYKRVVENNLDAAIGERDKLSSGSPLWRAPGKFFIRSLINSLVGVKLKDFNCGFRLIKRDVILRYLHICSDKFSFSTTSSMALISRGYNYIFIPIKLKSRNGGKSSVNVFSGLNTVYLVIKMIMLFNPLKIFFNSGIIFFIFGIIWGINYFLAGHGLSIGSLFFLITGILLLFLGLMADQISEIRKSQFENN